MRDLHELPKMRDGLSYLYVEHCRIDQDDKAVAMHDAGGKVPVPCASLALLMLGPGTEISHAAVKTLAESGCLIEWCGEESVRFYAAGAGETRSARNLLRQARLCTDGDLRLKVVIRLYGMRFEEPLPDGITLQQIRGREGVRVREAYAAASRASGVSWDGRSYDRSRWGAADPVNRALSAANSCLYGLCHAAIVSAGYSPGLGFIHTGKQLSFVYDIADLYKTETTIPAAFAAAAESGADLERRVRMVCRDLFHERRLLQRVVDDIQFALEVPGLPLSEEDEPFNEDADLPGGVWDPDLKSLAGGVNYADQPPEGSKEGTRDGRRDP
jgi:CRISPR-associated protein Cas1